MSWTFCTKRAASTEGETTLPAPLANLEPWLSASKEPVLPLDTQLDIQFNSFHCLGVPPWCQVVLSAEKKKTLLLGDCFCRNVRRCIPGLRRRHFLFSPAAEPSHDFMVHNLRRGVACSNHKDFIPRYWIRRYMLHVPYAFSLLNLN